MALSPPSPRSVLTIVIGAALLLAFGALGVTATGDIAAFADVANIQLIMVVVVWAILAGAIRWLVVGKADETTANSRAILIWGGFRVCLLLALGILLIGWVIALVLGHDAQRPFLQAVILLVAITVVTGIIGQATINSWLAVRHWAHRKSL